MMQEILTKKSNRNSNKKLKLKKTCYYVSHKKNIKCLCHFLFSCQCCHSDSFTKESLSLFKKRKHLDFEQILKISHLLDFMTF